MKLQEPVLNMGRDSGQPFLIWFFGYILNYFPFRKKARIPSRLGRRKRHHYQNQTSFRLDWTPTPSPSGVSYEEAKEKNESSARAT